MLNLDITAILRQAAASVKRFPLAIGCAFVAYGIALALLWKWVTDERFTEILVRLGLVAGLGIALFTAAQLYAEAYPARRGVSLGIGLAILAGLVLLTYPWVAAKQLYQEWLFFRLALLGVVLHAAVALAPFAGRGSEAGFWQFNKVLFLGVFTAALYTGVLVVGLMAALGSVQFLLGIAVKGEMFATTSLTVVLLFNTWFFLAGVPLNFEALEADTSYPKGLKGFTQFALLPLVVLYLLILYAFMAKTGITWHWPQGTVTWLVMTFAVVGILAFLLVWPLRRVPGAGWVPAFTSYFYWALLPLAAFELLALARRINQYGLTEERVLGVALTLWLVLVVAVGLVQRGRGIRVIPASLALVLLVITVGPGHAAFWSIRSQKSRLEGWLAQRHLTPNPAVPPRRLTADEIQDFESMARFLAEHHALDEVGGQTWRQLTGSVTKARLAETSTSTYDYLPQDSLTYGQTDSLAAAYGLVLQAPKTAPELRLPSPPQAIPLQGFRFAEPDIYYGAKADPRVVRLGKDSAHLTMDTLAITLLYQGHTTTIGLPTLEQRVRRMANQPASSRLVPFADSTLAAIYIYDYTKMPLTDPNMKFTLLLR